MKFVCSVCGYIYDEERENMAFSQLPDSWVCPLCNAPKSVFTAQEQAVKQESPSAPIVLEEEFEELSAGVLAALFSNLRRGCEKQYQFAEAEQFAEIASYFDRVTPAVSPDEVNDLAALVLSDLQERYPALESTATYESDRGALRVNTWGSRVTQMQKAILERYLQEGEAFLAHTNVWVCTVCGFIYIGDTPPALCPVCKVPDWKFQMIEGGVSA